MRIVGWLAMILGVIGLAICLVIAVGVWVVRPMVVERVDHIATVAVKGLDDASALSADASELLVDVSQRLDNVATTAKSISGNPVVDAVADRLLSAAVTNVVSRPWSAVQDRLGGMRERVVGISNSIQALDDAVPFIELPGTITGVVSDVDTRWTALDERVRSMEDLAADGVATTEEAARIADMATEASARLTEVNAALGVVHGAIETAQGNVQEAADQIEGLTGWGALVICVLAVWVGLLHLLLVAQGRRWVRAEA